MHMPVAQPLRHPEGGVPRTVYTGEPEAYISQAMFYQGTDAGRHNQRWQNTEGRAHIQFPQQQV